MLLVILNLLAGLSEKCKFYSCDYYCLFCNNFSHFASWNGVNWECPNNSTLIDNDVYSFASNSVGNEFILGNNRTFVHFFIISFIFVSTEVKIGGYFTSPQLYALKASNFNNSTSFNYTSPSISSSNELNGSVYAVLSVGDDFYLGTILYHNCWKYETWYLFLHTGGFFSSIAHWVVKLSNGVYSNISSSTIDSTARVLLKHEGYLYAGGNQNYGFSRIAIFPTPPPTPGPPTTTSEPSQSVKTNIYVFCTLVVFLQTFFFFCFFLFFLVCIILVSTSDISQHVRSHDCCIFN